MIALNEMLQALVAFECASDIDGTAQHIGHHEDGYCLQINVLTIIDSTFISITISHLQIWLCSGALQSIRARQ